MKNIKLYLLKLMLTIASLMTPQVKAANTHDNIKVKSDITVFANAEQVDDNSTFGDLTLKPRVTAEMGDYKAEYWGSFYNWGQTDHTYGDWLTLMSRIRLESPDWELQFGRMQLRPDFAGYLMTPMTTTLDNDVMLAGTTRTLTGTHITHKKSGFGIGMASSDTRMSFDHWDMGIVTWGKRFSPEFGVFAHVGAGDKGLHNASVTTAWMPTDKTSSVLEGVYNNKTLHGILGINHKLTNDLTLFGGTKITTPREGKISGWVAAGAKYSLNKNWSIVGAVKQDIRGDRHPHAILGVRFGDNFVLTHE